MPTPATRRSSTPPVRLWPPCIKARRPTCRRAGDPPAALEPAVAAISAIAPAEAARAAHLAEAIGAALRAVDPPRRLFHGDLYADQMLVHNGDMALIDFDNAALGDPAADLGVWIARHRVAADPTALRRQARALLAGYDAAGGCACGIEPHIAANLLRLAAEPFVIARPTGRRTAR
jgi:aminoglycoside phosphotransferase (APT) family kinase protein